jgi:hypothetical protein
MLGPLGGRRPRVRLDLAASGRHVCRPVPEEDSAQRRSMRDRADVLRVACCVWRERLCVLPAGPVERHRQPVRVRGPVASDDRFAVLIAWRRLHRPEPDPGPEGLRSQDRDLLRRSMDRGHLGVGLSLSDARASRQRSVLERRRVRVAERLRRLDPRDVRQRRRVEEGRQRVPRDSPDGVQRRQRV